MQFSNCFSDFFVWNICNELLSSWRREAAPPPHWKFMNHDMKENHQGMKDTTKTVLNIWPELKYLVQGGLNDYLFFFELFFFFIIKKPKKILIKSLMQFLLLCLGNGKERENPKFKFFIQKTRKQWNREMTLFQYSSVLLQSKYVYYSSISKHYLSKMVPFTLFKCCNV